MNIIKSVNLSNFMNLTKKQLANYCSYGVNPLASFDIVDVFKNYEYDDLLMCVNSIENAIQTNNSHFSKHYLFFTAPEFVDTWINRVIQYGRRYIMKYIINPASLNGFQDKLVELIKTLEDDEVCEMLAAYVELSINEVSNNGYLDRQHSIFVDEVVLNLSAFVEPQNSSIFMIEIDADKVHKAKKFILKKRPIPVEAKPLRCSNHREIKDAENIVRKLWSADVEYLKSAINSSDVAMVLFEYKSVGIDLLNNYNFDDIWILGSAFLHSYYSCGRNSCHDLMKFCLVKIPDSHAIGRGTYSIFKLIDGNLTDVTDIESKSDIMDDSMDESDDSDDDRITNNDLNDEMVIMDQFDGADSHGVDPGEFDTIMALLHVSKPVIREIILYNLHQIKELYPIVFKELKNQFIENYDKFINTTMKIAHTGVESLEIVRHYNTRETLDTSQYLVSSVLWSGIVFKKTNKSGILYYSSINELKLLFDIH